MRPLAFVLVLLTACSLGERGGEQAPPVAKPAAVTDAKVATAAAVAAPGTCEATVNKLVALSMSDAAASGKPWSEETRAKKHKVYLDRCTKELSEGIVTAAAMQCVEGSKDLNAARECLIAAAN
jgi:hypothetical protein